jgi:hydrogenase expression/formation protein HypD
MLSRIYAAHKLMDEACKCAARAINIMEVCGTHTVAIFRNGIRPSLPANMKLLSGPGCPVCVTDQGYIDNMLILAEKKDVIIATYGDMIRVPGKSGSLETRGTGSNVRVVLSSIDALKIAKENPEKIVVFIAVGFETTTPATAIAVRQAKQEGVDNFCILSGHKLVIPAMFALLQDPANRIDAFLCPGHVSVVIGSDAYKPVVETFNKPCVVAGFEPMQIIEGIAEICRQLARGRSEVQSVYHAVVTPKGNEVARKVIDEVFEPADGYWRGVGLIPKSTLVLRTEYARFDAAKRFGLEEGAHSDLSGCHCGEVLCGRIEPPQCPLFETACTPDTPVGPCMVSSEGACSAWFKYGRKRKRKT